MRVVPPCWFFSCAAIMLMIIPAARAQTQAPKKIDFAHDIVPILKARCAECHTNGTYKGGFSLDTREAVLKAKGAVPGKSAESEIIKRITSTDAEMRMPPKGERLTAQQAALFRTWIDEGMNWEPGFSFKANSYVAPLKPRRPQLPAARDGRDHPIDRILDAYFAANQIALPPTADDITFLRRVYLDLIGLLPIPAEIEAFQKDPAPDKRAKVVRSLLDDTRAYADHWLSFWNDLLRNDYSGTGYIDGGRKPISDWLYRSLVENKPYDRFVRELIAPTPESEGFIFGIKWRGNVNASQVRELQFSQNVSQVFFGINMKCASCHDSFIDAWKLDDAYSLAAVVANQPLEIHRCDKPVGQKARPRFIFPELGAIDATAPKAKRLEQLAQLVTHRDNGRFTRTIANRIWQRMLGRGLVHPVDMMGTKPWNEDLLDYLGEYLVDSGYDLKKLMEHIATSQAYQARAVYLPKELPNEEYRFRGPEVKQMNAEQFIDAVWMLTRTAPNKPRATMKLPDYSAKAAERQFVRASLMNADSLMRSLGRPNREQVVTNRGNLMTTLQALDLANGQILHETLTRGAGNLLKAAPKASSEALVDSVYLRGVGRKPTPPEREIALGLLGSTPTTESLADLLWSIVMLPEFQLIR